MLQLTNLLLQNGVPQEAVAWLFILPIAVSLVVAARQLVGIKGLGIDSPLLIGFAISSLGVQAGMLIFAVVLAMGFIMRLILTKVRLLYLPKSALIIISAVLALAVTLPFLPYKDNINLSLASFSLVIIVLSMEKFATLLLERGSRKTLLVLLETVLLALPVSYLVGWKYLENLVLTYPVLILAGLLIFNLLLGRWTGLRLSEFVRFKSVIFK